MQSEIARVAAIVLEDGRTLGEVTVVQPSDRAKINVVNGLAAGAGMGAAWVVLLGPRLRRVKDVQAATGLPLLADVSVPADGPALLTGLLDHRAAAYLPVDNDEADAVHLADRLGNDARRQSGASHSVVIAVATPRTRVERVRDAVEHSRRNGLKVQGLILATKRPAAPTDPQTMIHSEQGGHT